jgi:hypothetical protein
MVLNSASFDAVEFSLGMPVGASYDVDSHIARRE